MSNLNTIINKLRKIVEILDTNLGKNEVNHGIDQDMKKNSDDLYNKVSQIQSKMITIFDDLKPLVDKLRGGYEYSLKLQNQAKELGIETKKFVDSNSKKFEEFCKKLNLSNNDFIKTTEKRHVIKSQEIFKKVFDKVEYDSISKKNKGN